MTGSKYVVSRKSGRLTAGLTVAVAMILGMAPSPAVWAQSSSVTRLAGTDRQATAIQVANQEYPSGPPSKTVILASGLDANWIDSVTAAPLALALKAPVLLTDSTTSIGPEVTSYLANDGITQIILLGADANATLAGQLPSGVTSASLSGADRYATAAAVAQALEQQVGHAFSQVFLVNGSDAAMTDALAAAPFAAQNGAPILLAQPGASTLPGSEAGLVASNSQQTLYLVGSAQGSGLSGTYYGDTIQKIGSGSKSAAANAAALAQAFAPAGGYSAIDIGNSDPSHFVILGNGSSISAHLVDAIGGAPLAALQAAPILYVESSTIPTSTSNFLASSAVQGDATLTIFGGTASIPDSTVQALQTLLAQSTTTSTPPPATSSSGTVSISGQSFGSGQSATDPAVSESGSALTISTTVTNSLGNPVANGMVPLAIALNGQSLPVVSANGTPLQAATGAVLSGQSGATYLVPTSSHGVATVQISGPTSGAGSYPMAFISTSGGANVPQAYVQFVVSGSLGITPFGTSTSPYVMPTSAIGQETTGLVPVTVILPPVNGVPPQNVPVTIGIVLPSSVTRTSSGPYLSDNQGAAINTVAQIEYSTTVNTNSNGEATAYIDSNGATANPVEVLASATDSSGSLNGTTFLNWQPASSLTPPPPAPQPMP